jgi:ribonuclease BN (tRNA processing enzyme)
MKLVVLGSGSAVPQAARSASGYWLETDAGRVLLDMSADVPHRMAAEGLDWTNVDAIWLSHFHLDHMGGLAPFLFGTRSAPEMKTRVKPLRIYGPVGFIKILEAIDQSNHYRLLNQPFSVPLREVAPGEKFEFLPELQAETFSTPHTGESLAIRLTDKSGTVLVYTSDTGYSESLCEFATGASLLLLECSFHRNKPIQTHLELSEAMEVARRSAPETLMLTHFFAEWDGIAIANIADAAKELWPGQTVAAFDGLRFEFKTMRASA